MLVNGNSYYIFGAALLSSSCPVFFLVIIDINLQLFENMQTEFRNKKKALEEQREEIMVLRWILWEQV